MHISLGVITLTLLTYKITISYVPEAGDGITHPGPPEARSTDVNKSASNSDIVLSQSSENIMASDSSTPDAVTETCDNTKDAEMSTVETSTPTSISTPQVECVSQTRVQPPQTDNSDLPRGIVRLIESGNTLSVKEKPINAGSDLSDVVVKTEPPDKGYERSAYTGAYCINSTLVVYSSSGESSGSSSDDEPVALQSEEEEDSCLSVDS